MPNIKSAKKRLRNSIKANKANSNVRSRVATFRRKLGEVAETKDAALSFEAYKKYCTELDKAAKKGIIKKNTAARRKARAAARVRALKA